MKKIGEVPSENVVSITCYSQPGQYKESSFNDISQKWDYFHGKLITILNNL